MSIYNHILRLSNYIPYRIYMKGMKDVMGIQKQLLLKVLKDNADTVYGRANGFKDIHSIEAYQKKVPIMAYEDIEPYIQRSVSGEEKVLTSEPVNLFELSSGSTAPSKYIPYTSRLRTEFMAGIRPWLYDLYTRFPGVMAGKAYWSVSPVNHRNMYTNGGVPIGFQEDTGYFGPLQQWLLNRLFSVPSEVKEIPDITDFRYVTLYFLLKDASLSMISVWNPSFLSLMLEVYDDCRVQLVDDIFQGKLSLPNNSPIPPALKKKVSADPERGRYLSAITTSHEPGCSVSEIWPRLCVISCWDQGNAKESAKEMMRRFPGVTLQGKGILATEGLMTIPFEGIGHPVSYRSHFFEFIPVDSLGEATGEPAVLKELKKGHRYSVVMTTGGGFYRYRIFDLVEVTGHFGDLPLLKFISKESMVSDLVGEKVNALHILQIMASGKMPVDRCFISPVTHEKDVFGYCLYCDDSRYALTWMAAMETGLMDNYHYAYARHLKQLQPVKCFLMEEGWQRALYEVLSENQKLGDIKHQVLISRKNVHETIPGNFLTE